MKHTHTPGPWRVISGTWSEEGNVCYEIEPLKEIGAADAALISAAPDLLAALKDMLETPYLCFEETAERFKAARAAIEKAEGK